MESSYTERYRGFDSHPLRLNKMKLYLIRHGQTTGDLEGRFGGTYDDHLSPQGIQQAKKLSFKLEGLGIEIIYSSPYFRAKETAEILAKKLKIPIKIQKDLRERDIYAHLSGAFKKDHLEEVEKLKDFNYSLDGAEEYSVFKDRVLRAIENVATTNHQVLAIVSHGGPLKCFLREIFQKEIEPRDCELIAIEKNNDYKLVEE